MPPIRNNCRTTNSANITWQGLPMSFKITTILQWQFHRILLVEIQYVSIGLIDGLAPNRPQTITEPMATKLRQQ